MVWVLIIGVLGAGAYGKQYYPHVKCLLLHRFATIDMFWKFEKPVENGEENQYTRLFSANSDLHP